MADRKTGQKRNRGVSTGAAKFHRPFPPGRHPDPPDLGIDPRNLFTLPYMELIEAIAERLFPANTISSADGSKHQIRASSARIYRYVLFRAAWTQGYGARLQLALRDFSLACKTREADHFANLPETKQDTLLSALEDGSFTSPEWPVLRDQRDAFRTIYEAVSEGFFAEPGYGGNCNGTGWYYSNFMKLGG